MIHLMRLSILVVALGMFPIDFCDNDIACWCCLFIACLLLLLRTAFCLDAQCVSLCSIHHLHRLTSVLFVLQTSFYTVLELRLTQRN